MTTAAQETNLNAELTQALDELATALTRAAAAADTIRRVAPRLAATGSVFDEIEALVRAGRSQIGAAPATASVTEAEAPPYPRPTLVVPTNGSRARPVRGKVAEAKPESSAPTLDDVAPATNGTNGVHAGPPPATLVFPPAAPPEASATCFRLEFESKRGPLDLRTVDDAVGEHPAVRDVALLDYDGRRATLKVWIAGGATPSDVQDSLKARAGELFAPGADVAIIALEDVA